MRVMLINPFYPISETPSPPLGLSFLASALENAGAAVCLIDYVVTPYRLVDLQAALDGFSPDLVGVTSVSMTYDNAVEIGREIKRIDAGIPVVMGGPHVSFYGKETLQRYPHIDFVIRGEGDAALVELALAVDAGSGWQDISGLVYRQGSEIADNGLRSDRVDVDALPMPGRRHIPLGRYRALGLPVSMTTSRGCPFRCIFCVGRKMVGPGVRYRNPMRVVDELERLASFDFHQINIADDLFTADERHCLAVCTEILKRGLMLSWTSFARVDTVSRHLLATMKKAGCHTVSFGVESAVPEILKTIRKGITLEQVLAAVSLCVEVGITPQVSFILGLPGETPETVQETIAFGERLKEMGALHGFHLLAPFPGTDVRKDSAAYGIRILTDDWRQYHANRAVVETPSVSHLDLDAVVISRETDFDAYLGEIARRRDAGLATPAEAWPLTRLEHTVIFYELMMTRAVEERGYWRNGNPEKSRSATVATLAERIGPPDNFSAEQLLNSLSYALDQGYLCCTRKDGAVRWAWVDYL